MTGPITIAHNYIRERILSGEFAPGDALAGKHLAEQIGVSRTPVRDALRQLETEGLIEINPRQEARVKKASYEDIRDIWELRIALETHAATLAAARHSQEDLDRMEDLLAAMRTIIDKMDVAEAEEHWELYQQLGQSDLRFHLAILDASRNKLIKAEVDRFRIIHDIVLPIRRSSTRPQNSKSKAENMVIWESHQAIFKAIRRRDEMATYLAMKEHLISPMQRRMRILRQEMEIQSVRVPEQV